MTSSVLKKMLIFIISNTEGVIVLVCPAIFWILDGFSGRCYNHQADVMPVYWLMFCQFVLHVAHVVGILFCGRCCSHYCILLWQMLLPSFIVG